MGLTDPWPEGDPGDLLPPRWDRLQLRPKRSYTENQTNPVVVLGPCRFSGFAESGG
jgi:hypothetical protein